MQGAVEYYVGSLDEFTDCFTNNAEELVLPLIFFNL
jgi:hypothetical protein